MVCRTPLAPSKYTRCAGICMLLGTGVILTQTPTDCVQRPIQRKPKKQLRRGQHTVNKHLLNTKLR